MAKRKNGRGLTPLTEREIEMIDEFLLGMMREFCSGKEEFQRIPKKDRPESIQRNIDYFRHAERAMKTARGRNRQRRILSD